ncbi:MAG: hypothetical protein WCK80_01620 [bacterium]
MLDSKNLKKLFSSLLLILAGYLIQLFLINGVGVLKLKPAPPELGLVPIFYQESSKFDKLPIYGKNYTLENLKYLENGNWAAATLVSVPGKNKATVVMKKINGVFVVVMGPGTQFSESTLESLPLSVGTYLYSRGVYGS